MEIREENKFVDSALIIPFYNGECYLDKLFKLIDNLAGLLDIYFIDDKSTDGSLNIIKEKLGNKVVTVENSKNQGASFCRNYALKNIKKDFLIFLDPDVEIRKEDIFNLLKPRQDFTVVFPQINYFSGKILTPTNEFERQRCTNSAVFVVNRKKIEELGQYFDEDMKIYGEDNDFFSRLWMFKLKFKFCKDIIVKHPEKIFYTEEHYYQKIKNCILMFLKNAGLVKFRFNPIFWLISNLGLFFIAALLNRNFTVAQNGFEKVKFTKRSRLILFLLFFKAIGWNILNFNNTLKKRLRLKSQLFANPLVLC
ncbi:MAG: Glycosyl transferase GT2 family [Candidatus Magasanikbacteria bacterium GW2011_GWC2_40_17]|uniref:Glycosyl transferase GT2 family n=1 Tax=Candidatus Magasanikbacteria bacterium GW2011_GWA2_42_32 TaxID=1619039 RepID=A0A0G1A8N1_9BACT|nr:MAG: Glycosyl transferase GT2 family [Candidatus Magasanikbacteria bacterium GW2011_GWC2_40_17]KKS57402.1 MAG: Glycosyl transferase GT2 family [Candidatus Magasanikbacteria bacterium GW2011_GWA2_42_32]